MTSATDNRTAELRVKRLRELLDERGIEHYDHENGEPLRVLEKAEEPATSWRVDGASYCAVPDGKGTFDVWIDHCKPEQAIAATLGSVPDEAELLHDTREKLEEDVCTYLDYPRNCRAVYDVEAVKGWLDRQAAITERETLHSHPMCAGSDACPASNRPIGESVNRETPDTAGIGASKDEIRDFDVWNVAYEIYCAGGYVDNGNEPNPPTDGIRELLDRQAAITERECMERSTSERIGFDCAECAEGLGRELEARCYHLKERIAELNAERDEWKTKCETREFAYKQADAERKRYSEQIDELRAEIATLKEHRAGNMEKLHELTDECAELRKYRDEWKGLAEKYRADSIAAQEETERYRAKLGDVLDALHEAERAAR